MGVNLPTKTVVFFAIKKFDGTTSNYLNSSEYTQMAGRAGRRGLDDKGNVMIFIKDPNMLPATKDLQSMITKSGEEILSKFKISYNNILRLAMSNNFNIQELMKSSFSEKSRFNSLDDNKKKIEDF